MLVLYGRLTFQPACVFRGLNKGLNCVCVRRPARFWFGQQQVTGNKEDTPGRARLSGPVRVTTGAAPCTLAQSDVEASRCGCFAHAMHSVQGAARCANHCDAPRCRCTQVVMHRGARCTSVHGDARRAKMRCLSQYLTSLVFLVLLQCCPRVKETFNRAGIHLGAGAHSVQ